MELQKHTIWKLGREALACTNKVQKDKASVPVTQTMFECLVEKPCPTLIRCQWTRFLNQVLNSVMWLVMVLVTMAWFRILVQIPAQSQSMTWQCTSSLPCDVTWRGLVSCYIMRLSYVNHMSVTLSSIHHMTLLSKRNRAGDADITVSMSFHGPLAQQHPRAITNHDQNALRDPGMSVVTLCLLCIVSNKVREYEELYCFWYRRYLSCYGIRCIMMKSLGILIR